MRPVLLLDVNETLSDPAPLGEAFAAVGADPLLAEVWFAAVLRDGFALAATGGRTGFATLAEELLVPLLAGRPLTTDPEDAAARILGVLAALPPRADTGEGLRRLHAGGHRLATLTNGATSTAETLLERAGARDLVDEVLSVDDAGAWKPAQTAYRYAADRLRVAPGETMLVAVHPWDVHGAASAGLRTAWLRRDGRGYPSAMRRPEIEARDLLHLADLLG